MKLIGRKVFVAAALMLGISLVAATSNEVGEGARQRASETPRPSQGQPGGTAPRALASAHVDRPKLPASLDLATRAVPIARQRATALERTALSKEEAQEQFEGVLQQIELTVTSATRLGDPAPLAHERRLIVEDAVFAYLSLADHLEVSERDSRYQEMQVALATLGALDSDGVH